MTNSEYTRDLYLNEFRERCIRIFVHGGDLGLVRDRVIKKECPFMDVQFDKDKQFRIERRFYWKNDVRDDLLNIIQEVQNE